MRRGRGGVRPFVTILAIAWGGFFLHSCVGPRSPLDPAVFAEIHCAPRVQVGISKSMRVPAAAVIFTDDYTLVGAKGPIGKGTGDARAVEISWADGIRIGGTTYGETQVRINMTGEFTLNGTRYLGDLIIHRDDDKTSKAPALTLVNDVDLEQYLMGVVGMEMSLSASEEALKCQVIAARTYAMSEARAKTLRNVKGEKFDLYDDERSQVYGGLERTSALARRLVTDTRGLFCVYAGRIFKTYFSSTCGGHTEPAKLVLGEVDDIPPLRGTVCGHCTNAKHYRWKAEIPRIEAAKKVWGAESNARIKTIKILSTLPGGHALELGITVEGGTRENKIQANDGFRRKIDPRQIRSTFWDSVEVEGEKIVINGRGWGHAVGMCQTGAYQLALAGKTAAEILEYYYPQAKVQKLY